MDGGRGRPAEQGALRLRRAWHPYPPCHRPYSHRHRRRRRSRFGATSVWTTGSMVHRGVARAGASDIDRLPWRRRKRRALPLEAGQRAAGRSHHRPSRAGRHARLLRECLRRAGRGLDRLAAPCSAALLPAPSRRGPPRRHRDQLCPLPRVGGPACSGSLLDGEIGASEGYAVGLAATATGSSFADVRSRLTSITCSHGADRGERATTAAIAGSPPFFPRALLSPKAQPARRGRRRRIPLGSGPRLLRGSARREVHGRLLRWCDELHRRAKGAEPHPHLERALLAKANERLVHETRMGTLQRRQGSRGGSRRS